MGMRAELSLFTHEHVKLQYNNKQNTLKIYTIIAKEYLIKD